MVGGGLRTPSRTFGKVLIYCHTTDASRAMTSSVALRKSAVTTNVGPDGYIRCDFLPRCEQSDPGAEYHCHLSFNATQFFGFSGSRNHISPVRVLGEIVWMMESANSLRSTGDGATPSELLYFFATSREGITALREVVIRHALFKDFVTCCTTALG